MAECEGSTGAVLREGGLWWEASFHAGKLIELPADTHADPEPEEEEDLVGEVLASEREGEPERADGPRGVSLARVPSLLHLCLGSLVRACPEGSGSRAVPPRLPRLLGKYRESQVLREQQLRWLLGELVEKEEAISEYLLTSPGGADAAEAAPAASAAAEADEAGRPAPAGPVSRSGDFHVRQALRYDFSPTRREVGPYMPVRVENGSITELAHTIAIMLPLRLPLNEDDGGGGGGGNSQAGRADDADAGCRRGPMMWRALREAVGRIRAALSRVCPKLVRHSFDPAMAYVWWSRGDVTRAERLFARIAEEPPWSPDADAREPPTEERAGVSYFTKVATYRRVLYLLEVARLHTHVDRLREAIQSYQEATAAFLGLVPLGAGDCLRQSKRMIATACDDGLMGDELAERAEGAWDALIAEPDCHANLVQTAAESFLHCHAGFPTSGCSGCWGGPADRNAAWLTEARLRLRPLVALAPQVNLHLSLVLAAQGEDAAAEEAYMNYAQQFASADPAVGSGAVIPGSMCVFVGADIKPHPWWALTERPPEGGRGTAGQLRVLPLLWRRRFLHYTEDQTDFVGMPRRGGTAGGGGGVHGPDGRLSLTRDGLLTGWSVQNLPPYRPLLLDPLTGRMHVAELCPDDVPLPSGAAGGYQPLRLPHGDPCSNVIHFTPTPVVVYSSPQAGVSVTLLKWPLRGAFQLQSSFRGIDPNVLAEVELSYSGPDGIRKLSLSRAVREAKVARLCRRRTDRAPDDDDWAGDPASAEPHRYVVDQRITEGHCRELAEEIRSELELDGDQFLLYGARTVGRSVVLSLNTDVFGDCDVSRADTLVFADCTDRGAFRSPAVLFPERDDARWESGDYAAHGSAEVFAAFEVTGCGGAHARLLLFDGRGCLLGVHGDLSSPRTDFAIVSSSHARPDGGGGGGEPGHADAVLYANKARSRLVLVSANGAAQRQTQPLGNIRRFLTARGLVFVSLADRVLVLDASSLEAVRVERPGSDLPAAAAAAAARPLGPSDPRAAGSGILVTGRSDHVRLLSVTELPAARGAAPSPGDTVSSAQFILGLENRVLVLVRREGKAAESGPGEKAGRSPSPVAVLAAVTVPGLPTEACHVGGRTAGFVVTASVFPSPEAELYRENLYWFDGAGRLRGLHPFLGPGPHGFLAARLRGPPRRTGESGPGPGPGTSEERRGASASSDGDGRWHVFFADGLGSLCSVRLEEEP